MVPIIEYASLAWHVYSPDKRETFNIKFHDLKSADLASGHFLYPNTTWYRLLEVDSFMQPHNQFYAQLYVKFEQGRVIDAVMAIRGTVLNKGNNDMVDIASFSSDVLADGGADAVPIYLGEAVTFYNECERYLAKYFPCITQIKLTGHSLGGAVAQLIPLHAGYGVPAIVFNSPGCGHVPGVNLEFSGWIYNVNSRYDFINKIGLTLGHLFVVNVPNMASRAKAFFDSFNAKAYAESIQDYAKAKIDKTQASKMVDTMQAMGYRYYAYLAALDGAFKTPTKQSSFLQALDDATKSFWVNAETAVMNKVVDSVFFGAVLYAQHSIDNLLAALYLESNLKVAMTAV